MIPDLLLALMGVPGDVFTLHTDENGDESLVVAKDVDFIKIHEPKDDKVPERPSVQFPHKGDM